MMKAIEDGLYTASMKERMSELEDRRSALLATEPQASPNVVLHPNTAALYSEKIENLVTSLNADDIRAEAGEILRSLVDRVVLTPDDDGTSLKAELYGDLAGILTFSSSGSSDKKIPGSYSEPGSLLSVVAGARNRRYLHLDYVRI